MGPLFRERHTPVGVHVTHQLCGDRLFSFPARAGPFPTHLPDFAARVIGKGFLVCVLGFLKHQFLRLDCCLSDFLSLRGFYFEAFIPFPYFFLIYTFVCQIWT